MKKPFFRGGESPEKGGAWIVCRFIRRLGKKEKKGVMFLGCRDGVETPMHTISWRNLIDTNIQSK